MIAKWAIIYKTHQKIVYRLVKFAKNFPKVCTQDPKYYHYTHTHFSSHS